MAKAKENLVKLRCAECKNINYYTNRNKKKIKEKLELKSFANFAKNILSIKKCGRQCKCKLYVLFLCIAKSDK